MNINTPICLEALETVLDWGLPDELIPMALDFEVHRLSGMDAESSWQDPDSFH